jgi:hypothetical protein
LRIDVSACQKLLFELQKQEAKCFFVSEIFLAKAAVIFLQLVRCRQSAFNKKKLMVMKTKTDLEVLRYQYRRYQQMGLGARCQQLANEIYRRNQGRATLMLP